MDRKSLSVLALPTSCTPFRPGFSFVTSATAQPATGRLDARVPARSGPWISAWRRLRRSPPAVVGLLLIGTLVVVAAFAERLAPHGPYEIITTREDIPPLAPGPGRALGTDDLGRDVLSRIIHGSRISLQLGLISVAIGGGLGVTTGLVSGYYSGWVDRTIMRGIDVMLAFPGILLALVIVAILGPDLNNAMIAVGLAAMPHYTRVVRGSVLGVRELQYIEAARVIGCRDGAMMFRHILPNVLAPVIVLATLGVASAIIAGAALSFLGLGAKPPTPEWGAMLSEGRAYLRTAPWITTFPGAAIMVTVLAINLLGDGLRDALDPRMRR